MAYSNINRDKEQVGWANWAKNAGLVGFMLIIIWSSVANMWQQWATLNEARARNLKLNEEATKLIAQNKILEKQIEYATSSAYINQKTREYLGLGSQNDYWLKLPKDIDNSDIKPEFNEVAEVPIIWQWWNLFTK